MSSLCWNEASLTIISSGSKKSVLTDCESTIEAATRIRNTTPDGKVDLLGHDLAKTPTTDPSSLNFNLKPP